MKSRRTVLLLILVVIGVAILVLACRPVVHTVVSGPFTIRYWQKSSQRIDRTTFEYTFQGEIETTGPVENGVKARVSSSNPNTTTTDAFLMFPGAAPGTIVASFDTFTIRQSRTSAFDPAQLQWAVTGMAIPPDPGPANDTTIAGVDSDGDGIRDDLQRYNEMLNPQSARLREGIKQTIRVFQDSISDAGAVGLPSPFSARLMRAAFCVNELHEIAGLGLEEGLEQGRSQFLDFERLAANTKDRADRYLAYASSLSGGVNDTQRLGNGASCDFDYTLLPD